MTSRLLTVLLLVPLTATSVAAQAPRPMTIVDLINVPSVSNPELSPDGSQIVYVQSNANWDENRTISHVWRVNADGTDPTKLTVGKEGQGSPHWSPDGSSIAFLADRDESGPTQIFLLPTDGGEALPLTDHVTSVGDIAWSPDGRWIYFTADDDETAAEKARAAVNDNVYAFSEDWEYTHLWRVSVADGTEERITSGDFNVRGFEIARDGSLILHSRTPTPHRDDGPKSELWVMAMDGGNARQLTQNTTGEGGAELSPDNSRILFVANANGDLDYYYNDKIFLLPASGGAPELFLPDMPHEVGGATWSADGSSIYFTANTGVRQELFAADVATREVTQLTRGDHSVSDWSYYPELGRHIFSISSPTNAGDLWTLAEGESAPERMTKFYDHLAQDFRLPEVEAIQWEGEDGVMVEGLLYYPLDYRAGQPYPLVVQTHGGPASSDQFSWHSAHDYVPVLAARGYAVLQPNYRGSTGYGDDFLRNMVGSYFDQSHKDVMAGVDYLIDQGIVDGDQLAKMGWSAGGHMTNKIITYTDRFKAASSGAGAVNWVSMYGQSDTRVYRTPWFGGTPWKGGDAVEKYLEASPIFDMYKVTTPTIVLVGEDDDRVPMPQSVELYRALKANGVPTHLYVAPGQGHGWRELQQRLFKANVEIDWFERWVRNREYTWELSPVHPGQSSFASTGN
ncbi:MAG TPA: S9 family peptidase [Longimicrobiaceae bacterium]|nr:S9 family peptidase [Longimicrobiaceae bacterium]